MSTRYIVENDQGRHHVVIAPIASGYRVSIDGTDLEVDCVPAGGTVQSLLIGGRSYEVATMPTRDGIDVYVSGDVFRVRVTDELWARAEAGAQDAGGGEQVASPMPGAVIGISVSLGDTVSAGQTVAVVEAMKMQNDVPAERGGRVLEVRVKAGDVVEQGSVLMVLGPQQEAEGG